MITIRPARIGDETGIARVQVLSWQFSYKGIFPDEMLAAMSIDERATMWGERIADIQQPNPKIDILIAEVDGFIQGFTCLSVSRKDNADPHEGEITAVYVHPSNQGQGIGQLLLKEAFAELKHRGFKTVFVHTLEESPYKRFYVKHGGTLQDKISTRTFQDGISRNLVEYQWDL